MKKKLNNKIEGVLNQFTDKEHLDKIRDFIDMLLDNHLAYEYDLYLKFSRKTDARVFCHEIISFISEFKQNNVPVYLKNKSLFDNLLLFIRCSGMGIREGISFDNGYRTMILVSGNCKRVEKSKRIKDLAEKMLFIDSDNNEEEAIENSETVIISTFSDIAKHVNETPAYEGYILNRDGNISLHSTVKSAITMAYTEPILISLVDGIIDIKYLLNLNSHAEVYPINLSKWEDKLYELDEMTKDNVQDCLLKFNYNVIK